MADQLVENDQLVDALRGALQDGAAGLRYVPSLVIEVCEGVDPAWRSRYDRGTREPVNFDHFEEFVRATPTKGLGADLGMLKNLCKGHPRALAAIEQATQRSVGHPESRSIVDNINDKPAERPTGTSAAQALRRLRKDRPDLHERVLAGELSPHGAMVTAGFRPRTATVRLDDPEAIARTLRRQLDHDALVQLVAHLLGADS